MKVYEFIDGFWKLVKNNSVVSGLISFKVKSQHEKHQTTLDLIKILGFKSGTVDSSVILLVPWSL